MGKAERGIYSMDRNVGSPCETWLVAGHDLSALHPKRTYSGTTRSSRLRTGHDTPMGKSLVYCFLVSQSRYETRCYFNVRSKADISQLNLPHGTDN